MEQIIVHNEQNLNITNKNLVHAGCQLNRRYVLHMHIKEDNEDDVIHMHANPKLKESFNY